jgi:hypothetical protein
MNASVERHGNQLLMALPDAEWQRWQPLLEAVELPLGKVLYESGRKLGHVYFPTTAIVSLLYVMEDGASAEIAVVGARAWSASRCSWAASRPPAARWCKAPARGCA